MCRDIVYTAAGDVWMIGDNPVADVQGARNAGIRAIFADGAYPDSNGMTVLEASHYIVGVDKGSAPVLRSVAGY